MVAYVRLWMVFILLLVLALGAPITHAVFKSPRVTSTTPSGTVNISVETRTPETPYVKYGKVHEQVWRESAVDGGMAPLNMTYVDEETTYQYYLVDDGIRFPAHGFFYFTLSDRDSSIEQATEGLLGSDAQKYCYPNAGDFSCDYEDFQAAEILRFARASSRFNNTTYERILLNLTSANITSTDVPYTEDGHCDHAHGDFDCETNEGDAQHEVVGGVKQGLMIYSMWNAYAVTHNDTIKQLALNYTLGRASDCDVWNDDFVCENAQSQGAMILGYLEAYRHTANETFYTIARELSRESTATHPLKAFADWRAYQMTGNASIRERATDMTTSLIGNCTESECSSSQHAQHLLLFTEAYTTVRSDSYRHALQKLLPVNASDCAPMKGNFTCELPEGQGLLNYAFLEALTTITGHPTFSAPQVYNATYGGNMTLTVDRYGYLPDPTLYYKHQRAQDWKEKPLNGSLAATVDTILLGEGVVEFRFNSSRDVRFPQEGAFHVVLPLPVERFRTKAQLLSEKDPLHFCDPFGSDEQYANFSCKVEDMQGWMILSRALSADFHNDSQMRSVFRDQMEGFSDAYVDENNFSRSTCEFNDNDYECEHTSEVYPSDPYKEPAAVRQAMMAMGMLSLYRSSIGNDTHKRVALNYLTHPSESCAPIHDDFDCGDSSTMGYISLAYWDAAKTLGKHRFYEVARELADRVQNANTSAMAALSLWRAYAINGSEAYRSAAQDMMSNLSTRCVEDTCAPFDFAKQNLLYWDAYRISGNISYAYDAYLKSTSQTGGDMQDCHPNSPSYDPDDPQTEDVFQCKTPDTQGLMTSAFTKAWENYFLAMNHSFSINMSPVNNVSFASHHTVNCSFTNTGNATVRNVYLTLNTLQTINETETNGSVHAGGERVLFKSVGSGESKNVSWTLNATYGGKQTLSCWVEENAAQRSHVVTDIPPELELQTLEPSYWPASRDFTKSYVLHNRHDFKLSDTSVSIAPPDNMTVDTIRTAETTVEDNTLQVPLLYTNLSFNVTYSPEGVFADNSTVTTDFSYSSAAKDFTERFIFYETFVDIGLLHPTRVSMYDDFSITLSLNYTQDFAAENLTLRPHPPSSFQYQNVSTNLSHVTDATSSILRISELNHTKGYTSWRYFANRSENTSMTFNASAPRYNYQDEFSTSQIRIMPSAFTLNATYPDEKIPYDEAVSLNVTLASRSNVTHNLTNVTIEPRVSDGVTLTEKTSLYAFSSHIISHPSEGDMTEPVSRLHSTDNDSVAINDTEHVLINFTDISYNYSRLADVHLRLRHKGDNASRLNASFLNNSLETKVCSVASMESWNLSRCPVGDVVPNGTVQNETLEFLMQAEGNVSLDMAVLNRTRINETDQGGNETAEGIRFANITSGERTFTRWGFQVSSTDDSESITYGVSSQEGTYDTLRLEIPVEEAPTTDSDTTTGSPGGGGGGGVPPTNTSGSDFPVVTWYTYEPYNISAYLPSRNELQEFLPYSVNLGLHEGLYNHSMDMAGCLNISRRYQAPPDQEIDLNVSYECASSSYFVLVYEELQGGTVRSREYLNVTELSASLFENEHESVFHAGHLEQGDSFRIHYVLENSTEENNAPYDFDFIRPLVFGYPDKETAYEAALNYSLEHIQEHIPDSYGEENASDTNESSSDDPFPKGGESNVTRKDGGDNESSVLYGNKSDTNGNATISYAQLEERVVSFYNTSKGYIAALLILGAVVSVIVYTQRIHVVEQGLNTMQRALLVIRRSISAVYGRFSAQVQFLYHSFRRGVREALLPFRMRSDARYTPRRKESQPMRERFLAVQEKKLQADRQRAIRVLAQEDLKTAYQITNNMKWRLQQLARYYEGRRGEERYSVLRRQFSFILKLYKYVYYTVSIRRLSRDIMKQYASRNADQRISEVQREQENFERSRATLYKQLKGYEWFAQFKRLKKRERQTKKPAGATKMSLFTYVRTSLHMWFKRLLGQDPFEEFDAELYYLLNELRHHLDEEDMDKAKETFSALKQVRRKVEQSFNWRPRSGKHDTLLKLYERVSREMKEMDQKQQTQQKQQAPSTG